MGINEGSHTAVYDLGGHLKTGCAIAPGEGARLSMDFKSSGALPDGVASAWAAPDTVCAGYALEVFSSFVRSSR